MTACAAVGGAAVVTALVVGATAGLPIPLPSVPSPPTFTLPTDRGGNPELPSLPAFPSGSGLPSLPDLPDLPGGDQ